MPSSRAFGENVVKMATSHFVHEESRAPVFRGRIIKQTLRVDDSDVALARLNCVVVVSDFAVMRYSRVTSSSKFTARVRLSI